MLVGRERESQVLRETLARAGAGSGAALVLVGDAGVGKSHLLASLEEEARAGEFTVGRGRCFPDTGARAFAPWRPALGKAPFASRESLGAREVRSGSRWSRSTRS